MTKKVKPLRGAMVAPYAPPADANAVLAEGAKVIRYQMVDPSGAIGNASEAGYRQFIEGHLTFVDHLLAMTKADIILDLHTLPGGTRTLANGTPRSNMFDQDTQARGLFVDVWRRIGVRYRGQPRIIAFDVMNEPAGTKAQVEAAYKDAIKAIRENSSTPCIVSPPFGDPTRVKAFGNYSKLKNIWVTIHMYQPMAITHQGVYTQYPDGKKFPTERWNKKALEKVLRDFKDFMPEVPHFVGEFSISKYADVPSRVKYLQACISIFKSWGFSWCYHAWRESPIWNVEDVPELMTVLRKGWK